MRRIPVSLKIDDESLYTEVVEPKKKDHELSTILVALLKLYQIDDVVKKRAEAFLLSQSPYLKIREELNRIAMEHDSHSMSLGMVEDYTKNEVERLKREEEKTEDEKTEEPKCDEINYEYIMNRLTGIQETLKVITEVVQQNKSITQKETPRVEERVEKESTKGQEELKELKELNEPKVIQDTGITSRIVQEIKGEEVREEEEKRKPASFGKLLKSVK